MDDFARKYIADSGFVENLDQDRAKEFFYLVMNSYRDKKLSAEQVSAVINIFLYEYLYDSEVKIEDSSLLSAMELARELNEAEEGTVDYEEGIMKPLNTYLSENAPNS